MFESFPNQEKQPVTKEAVIQAFKEKGKEDESALALLREWREQQESKIEEIKDSFQDPMLISTELEISQAELLRDAGLLDEAYETINDALELPNCAPTEELLQKMISLRGELKNM